MNINALLRKSVGAKFSKLASFLAITGVGLGTAVILITIAVVQGYQGEVPQLLKTLSGDAQVLPAKIDGSFESGILCVPKENLIEWANNDHIESVYPFALKAGITQTETDFEGIILQGVGTNYPKKQLGKVLVDGHIPNFSENGKECAIPEKLAKKLRLHVGDQLPVIFVQQPPRARAFRISGIFKNPLEHETGRPLVLVSISHIQKINGWGTDTVGGYQIHFKDGTPISDEVKKIHSALPIGIEAFTLEELFPQLYQWLQLFDTNQAIILSIMLAVAGLNMMSALVLLVLEKKKEIGLLRALGMPRNQISKMFRRWALQLVVWGLVAGNFLAGTILLSQYFFHWMSLNEELYYLNYVPVYLNSSIWMVTNAGIAVFCWLAMMVPSNVVARLSPVESLKD
jgi:lipoprotein-releasing system permease protein